MKSRNYTVSVKNAQEAHALLDEYKFIGREAAYDADKQQVTLFALPAEYKKKRERDSRINSKREREEEGYEKYL